MTSTLPSQPNDLDLAIEARPSSFGRFGRYGGQYVPETLMPALNELEEAVQKAWQDKEFTDELNHLLKSYVGRATPLYEATRLTKYYRRKDIHATTAFKMKIQNIWQMTFVVCVAA